MAETIDNVKLGIAAIVFNSVAIGHTKGGVELSIIPEIKETTVDKYGSSPVKVFQTGTRIEVKTQFAESDLPHLLLAIQGAELDEGASLDQINLGKISGAAITGAPLTITPTGITNQKLTLTKAIVISAPTFLYKTDEENIYEVVWLATIDETKTDGKFLGNIGDADPVLLSAIPDFSKARPDTFTYDISSYFSSPESDIVFSVVSVVPTTEGSPDDWISIGAATGILSGTLPAVDDTFTVTVGATNDGGTKTDVFIFTVTS